MFMLQLLGGKIWILDKCLYKLFSLFFAIGHISAMVMYNSKTPGIFYAISNFLRKVDPTSNYKY